MGGVRYDKGMIGKLTGQFDGASADNVALIDVGGVGYTVRTHPAAIERLRQGGAIVSLFIHTAVRDDAIDLYGFPTDEELAFFKQLMSVSGVGPKTALGFLNAAEVGPLKRAIAKGDAAMLTKGFGIGKKSAERLVVELRDKLADEATHAGTPVAAEHEDDGEVVEALMALGYRLEESRRAMKECDPAAVGTREKLASALKALGSRAKSF